MPLRLMVMLGCLCAPAVAQAAPMKVRSLTPVSAATPFSDCPFNAPPPFTDNEWQPKDTAVEPHVAIDPANPNRMAAAWMQDFTQGIVVAATHDGGRTWERSIPPMLSTCSGADGASADPRLAYGADGTLYLSSMRNIRLSAGRTTPEDEVAVSRSRDGGLSWSEPVVVRGRDAYNDYPSIAADPREAGRVYVSYTRATEPFGNALGTMFAISEDGGMTFSEPREIYNTGRTGFYTNGRLLAQRDGRLLLLLWVYDGVNYLPVLPDMVNSRLVALTSSDGGRTWAEPVTVGEQAPVVNPTDPESGTPISSGGPTAAPAADGGWWVAWQDFDGPRARLSVARGRSDGTWDQPREVLGWADRHVLFPLVAQTPEGTLGVMWYDTRNDRPDDGRYVADVFFAESRDGGATFKERHVTGPMNLLASWNDARSFNGQSQEFIGDYLGIAARPRGFIAALPLTAPLARFGKSQLFVADVREPAARKRKAKMQKKRSRRKAKR